MDYGFSALSSAMVCAFLATSGAFCASKLLSRQLTQVTLLKSFKMAKIMSFMGLAHLLSDRVPMFSLGLILAFGSQSIIFRIVLVSIER